jgi:hypothetical protein
VAFKMAFIALTAMIVSGEMLIQPAEAVPVLGTQDFIVDPTGSSATVIPGQWKPTAIEAAETKAVLLDYLSSGPPFVPGVWTGQARLSIKDRISSYSLQYIGVHYSWSDHGGTPTPSGDREILVNGLCKVEPEERAMLTKQKLIILDGGECFFQAFYSLAKQKIVWFSVNGRA